MTWEVDYSTISKCDSDSKCQAKAPAKHFEDKKQDTPVVAKFMSVAGHPHEEQEEQHSLLFGGNIDENFYGKPGYDR